MGKDLSYINGIVAASERNLLKDRLFRMCEQTAEDAFRTLTESGYGQGTVNEDGVYGFEKYIEAEESALDAFVRENSPSNAELNYLLCPRDFHNAKAFVKAKYLQTDASPMLGPEGLIPCDELKSMVESGDFGKADPFLQKAVLDAQDYLQAEGNPSGAQVGAIFESALYRSLAKKVKFGFLKHTLTARADMLNMLTAFRAQSEEEATPFYVSGGKLKAKELSVVFTQDWDKVAEVFQKTAYFDYAQKLIACRVERTPFTECEKLLASAERRLLEEHKYQLSGKEPFLYYVFRKRAENADVRVVFVCLLAGMNEQQIKKRLRAL